MQSIHGWKKSIHGWKKSIHGFFGQKYGYVCRKVKKYIQKNFDCGAVKTYILTCFVEIFDIFKKKFLQKFKCIRVVIPWRPCGHITYIGGYPISRLTRSGGPTWFSCEIYGSTIHAFRRKWTFIRVKTTICLVGSSGLSCGQLWYPVSMYSMREDERPRWLDLYSTGNISYPGVYWIFWCLSWLAT